MAIKYIQLAAVLRTNIREGVYGAEGRLPTEMQLAAQHNVSRQTVRQALALLASEGLIEKRQGSGSHILDSTAQAAGNNIAVVTSYVNDYRFPSLFQNVQNILDRNNYSTLVYSTQNQTSREREILQTLLEHPVRGLLMEGVKTALPNPNLDLYQRLKRSGIPMVFLHGCPAGLNAVCISDDNETGGYHAVQYLLEKGHTNIGGLFKSDDLSGHQRYLGFQSALRDRGLPFPDERIFWYSTGDRHALLELGQNHWLTRFLPVIRKECTAVVCQSDEIAYPLIQLLLAAGIHVPRDVSVISFDNSYYSDMGAVSITSFAGNSGKMGRLAAQALLDQIRGKPSHSQLVDWQLVEKNSVSAWGS